jgi:hypothetical protein
MNSLKMFSYENLFIWMMGFVILSLMVERGLYQVYQTKAWKKAEEKFNDLMGGDYADLKPWVSIAVCVYIAYSLKLDLPAFLFKQKPEIVRIVLTGLLLSGGSTALMWIFKRAGAIKAAAHGAKLAKINGGEEL